MTPFTLIRMCESINNTLTNQTDYKEHELHLFVDKIYAFVESQEISFKSSNRSDHWHFWQEFQHFEMDSNRWFNSSEKAQKSHINRVLMASLESFQQYMATPVHVDNEDEQQLSVKHESLINTDVIPTSSLKDIWIKAKKLLFTAGQVVLFLGSYVPRTEWLLVNTMSHNHVAYKSSDQFMCSGIYARFST